MCRIDDKYKRGKEMKLLVYGPMGTVPMVVDDDISQEELGRLINIALTVEQGNGRTIKEVQNARTYKELIIR